MHAGSRTNANLRVDEGLQNKMLESRCLDTVKRRALTCRMSVFATCCLKLSILTQASRHEQLELSSVVSE